MIVQWDLCLCERIGSHAKDAKGAKEWWLGIGDWGWVVGEW